MFHASKDSAGPTRAIYLSSFHGCAPNFCSQRNKSPGLFLTGTRHSSVSSTRHEDVPNDTMNIAVVDKVPPCLMALVICASYAFDALWE